MLAWLPTLFVILLTAAALAVVGSPATGAARRRLAMAGIFLLGLLALAASVAEQRRTAEASADARPSTPTTIQGEANGSELAGQVRMLKDRVGELEANADVRLIGTDRAGKFSEYLRQFTPHLVIVSCIPDDVEAYNYANQIVNILKAGNWDARGPEITRIFGDIRAMGINVYGGGGDNSETIGILLDGFVKFNIPYHIRLAPSDTVPDSDTVELFIGAKPAQSAQIEPN